MIQLPSPGTFSLYSSCWHNMAYLVDRCLWATPSLLLSIIKGPVTSYSMPIKPIQTKSCVIYFLPQCRWDLLQTMTVSSQICFSSPVEVCSLSLTHFIKTYEPSELHTNQVNSRWVLYLGDNLLKAESWLSSGFSEMSMAWQIMLGCLPGKSRCIIASFMIHIQTMSFR